MNHLALRLHGALGLLIGLAPVAFAASSVDLTVHGSITPSACSIGLDNEGRIDFGKIAARSLNPETFTPLPPAALSLGVNCDAAAIFALRLTDYRADSNATPPIGFGLGLINGIERLGVYHVGLHTPLADNGPITQLQSLNNGQSWSVVDSGVALPALRLAAFGDASSGVWAPVPIKDLRVAMRVTTYIAPAQGLTLDKEVPLDGSALLELIYL
ncbi:DUF1120 domain-containing protein [Pseudomonas kairouanensis]|uniref:DUF1120 domain-containing protein n=1 Tax=Pseudomonas kairouanensis TaxID=2293832 RepID=A0A4Z0B1R6_9PSED|nr:DUF1120 domain-containing protein [Pseudomonas kairouanensis]TFY92630.1 DUF1120 domain-containing protein [Pseudomonas kairouanensis]